MTQQHRGNTCYNFTGLLDIVFAFPNSKFGGQRSPHNLEKNKNNSSSTKQLPGKAVPNLFGWMPSSPSSCSSENASVSILRATLVPELSGITGQQQHSESAMAISVAVMSEGGSRLPVSRNEGQTGPFEHVDAAVSEHSKPLATHCGVMTSTNSSAKSHPCHKSDSTSSVVASTGDGLEGANESDKIGTSASQLTSTAVSHQKLATIGTYSTELSQKLPTDPSETPSKFMGKASHHTYSKDSKRTGSEKQGDDSSSRSASSKDTSEKNMSIDGLVPDKKPRKRRSPQVKNGQTSGRWTQQEHQAFLEGLRECGREWKKVAMRIPTRTSAQIRSHAQKYFSKIQREHDTSFFPEGPAIPSSGCAGSSVGADTKGSMAPTVQRTVDQILANPEETQRQVESTLEALRERYRQLQRRLEQRQHQRLSYSSGTEIPSPSRKRALGGSDRPRVPSFSSTVDDHSSVCSNISASVASMGNDELIALSVLGGSLPRGDSSQDLDRLVARASGSSSDVSIVSSTNSAHAEQDDHHDSSHHDDAPEPKRPRSD